MPSAAKRLEPKRRVLKQSEIPTKVPLQPPKGYWDSVLRHLELLGPDDALEITLRDEQDTASMKSSLWSAARRHGVRLRTLTRKEKMYVWIAHRDCPTEARQRRTPIECEVCRRTIIPPRTGASRQFVCAGIGNRKSRCQKIRRYAREHDISIEEAIKHFRNRRKSILNGERRRRHGKENENKT